MTVHAIESALDWEPISVASGDVEFTTMPRQVICAGAGDLACRTQRGVARTIAVLAGLPYNISPQAILQTGTTATGIVVLY